MDITKSVTVDGLQPNNRLLTVARQYIKQGFSVIPIAKNSKIALVDWKEYTNRYATDDELIRWFSKECNLAIITGKISNLIVIDLDGLEGQEEAKKLDLKSSLVVFTGKGKHLYFKWQPNIKNAVRVRPGIDIRSDNGLVIAPPSIHENGRRYRWLSNGVVSVAFNNHLPIFPKEILCTVPSAVSNCSTNIKSESWISEALKGMKNGNIDDTLFTICSRLRADNWSSSDALALLQPHAERVGATEGHLEAKIENVWNRYTPNNPERSVGLSMASISDVSKNAGLVIHSPTNAESWTNFAKRREESADTKDNLKTGYVKLDSMLKGGLKSSRLFTVAARTGVGKTNWILGVSKRLCLDGKRVLLFSTEMPYAQIWERYISALETPTEFPKHQFHVCDSFAPNLERVEEAINEIKPDVFMFDHANHVSEEVKELGVFMQGLNFLRRKYDCAGIVVAQLNRSADWVDLKTGTKVEPRLSMLKGSGTLEQASSRVLLLSETRVTPEYTEIVGHLAKNDNGERGIVHFGLYKNPWRIVEL